MGKTVSNGTVDGLAAAVPAPYGPLVRVTSAANLPTPNSEITWEFTSDLGVTVYLTIEQLEDADIALNLMKAAHGVVANARALSAAIDAIDVVNETVKSGGDYTQDDFADIMDAITLNLSPWIGGRY